MANDTAVGQYTGPMLGFDQRFNPAYSANPYFYQDDPTYAVNGGGSRQSAIRQLAAILGLGQPPEGLRAPTGDQQAGVMTQQPTTPINTAQGSPQRLQSAPNSAPLVGGQANHALTNGGGYPMGGLPTQQPMTELSDFNHMNMAQPISGPQNPFIQMAQMKRQQLLPQLLAKFRQAYNLGQR